MISGIFPLNSQQFREWVLWRVRQTTIPVEDLKRQWQQIEPEIMQAVARVLPSGRYTVGPELAAFEFGVRADDRDDVRHRHQQRHGGAPSGTAGLRDRPGDEVITVPNTYVATIFAISYCGATPVFVDVEPRTYNIDARRSKPTITPRTKAILPVHLYGQIANIEPVVEIAQKHRLQRDRGLRAHARRDSQRKQAGSFGDVGCFSFYPTKVMGAFGDGGMCITSDPAINEKIRQLRYMGQRTKYNHEIVGYQERLDELQAAMLRVKLRYLPEWIDKRQQIAAMYDELLTGLPVQTPLVAEGNSHVYYLYTILRRTPRRPQTVSARSRRRLLRRLPVSDPGNGRVSGAEHQP